MASVEDEEDILLYKMHNEVSKRGHNLLSLRAYEVVDFSSQYGSDESLSYTAENILGPPTIYPLFGDHAYSFQFRTYGRWWQNLPSHRKSVLNLPYGITVESQDFIEFRVEKRVVPLLIRVYEVYNPGAIVKILSYCYDAERWVVLWQGEPQIHSTDRSHCFKIDFEGVNFLSDYYRIEFHHKHLNYYYEIDGLILYGEDRFPLFFPGYNLQRLNCQRIARNSKSCNKYETCSDEKRNTSSHFDSLPGEVMHLIISYLDLQSLCTASKVSKIFREFCYDSVLYKDLNLQLYCHMVDSTTLKCLESRLTALKKLNLSWCGGQARITPPNFIEFVEARCKLLTSLNLSCCPFVNNNCLKAVMTCCPGLQELNLQCCRAKDLTPTGFRYISQMTNLTYLHLYRTLIDKSSVLSIVKSCVKLEHLFLGSCTNIGAFNEVAKFVARNLRYIKTLDLWRAISLTCAGVYEIAEYCHDLVELDLGWCFQVDASCGCVRQLIIRCQKLKKLVLTAIRTISNSELNMISSHCNGIEQLDILGTSDVTIEAVLNLLQCCKNLQLLDVSYCDSSVKAFVKDLQESFPNVEIKSSTPPSR